MRLPTRRPQHHSISSASSRALEPVVLGVGEGCHRGRVGATAGPCAGRQRIALVRSARCAGGRCEALTPYFHGEIADWTWPAAGLVLLGDGVHQRELDIRILVGEVSQLLGELSDVAPFVLSRGRWAR